jgi:hypothetical protein
MIDAIDPTDEPLGMYDQSSVDFEVHAVTTAGKFVDHYRVTVPQHDRHVRSTQYGFTSLEALVIWIRAFDARLHS